MEKRHEYTLKRILKVFIYCYINSLLVKQLLQIVVYHYTSLHGSLYSPNVYVFVVFISNSRILESLFN